jgi:Polyketide cyclase / dehydrase and lipid transport
MEPVTVQTVVDAPREEVFDFVADLANAPAYLDHFISDFRLERLESAGVGAAARFKIDAPLDVMAIWVEIVIDGVSRPHRIHASGRAGRFGRMPCEWLWELVETERGLTEVTLTMRTEPRQSSDRLRARLGAVGFIRRRSAKALRRLRDVIESDGSVPRTTVAGGTRIATGVR